MDECWVDITTLAKDFDDAERIANNIREDIKFELGLTISVGVSFNKVFAKLGSDMKKPDATTVITQENFQNKVWPLPASDLLGVGRATKKALDNYNIRTIGDLAKIDRNWMNIVFGKNGQRLSEYANGIDYSEVARFDEQSTVKSVGHGITTVKDLENNDEVWRVILELSQDIGFKLRRYKKRAKAVSISIRDNKLVTRQWQMQLKTSIQSSIMIAEATFELFKEKYDWTNPIRTVTITAIKLIEEDTVENLTFFTDIDAIEKVESVEKCIEKLNERFGDGIVKNATLLKEGNMPRLKPKLEMPTGMPQPKR
jgi:DNA polymerase-4